MKAKNIFLTGDLHVGKSTLIRQVLSQFNFLKIGGFFCEAIIEKNKKTGYKMISFIGEEQTFAHLNLNTGVKYSEFFVDLKIFDTFGVDLLQCAMHTDQIIIMDELGVMEKDALHFQKVVQKCLASSIPVLGAFQLRAQWVNQLLDQREDCKLFRITKENREQAYSDVMRNLRNIFDQVFQND